MSKTLPLLQGEIILDATLQDDDNMLQGIGYPVQRFECYLFLFEHCSGIEAIVLHNLGSSKTETCQMGEFEGRMAGSFNVCLLIKCWFRATRGYMPSVELCIMYTYIPAFKVVPPGLLISSTKGWIFLSMRPLLPAVIAQDLGD